VFYFVDHSMGSKSSLYDSGVRTPLAVWAKDLVKGGRVETRMAQNIDFAPTLFELAGARPPHGMTLDGRSLVPLLQNAKADWPREDLYFEVGYERAVRTERWKYIAVRYPEDVTEKIASGELERPPYHYFNPNLARKVAKRYPHYFDLDQLYDLENDPKEQNNLAADPKYAEVLGQMKGRLREYLKSFAKRPFEV
jgi:arylsulfatase A-like enzyme